MSENHSHVCPWWLAYTFETPLRKFQTPPERVLKPYLKEGMTFVDLGCGMGFFSINGAKIVGSTGKVISVDIQQKMLDVLMKNAKNAKVENIIEPHLAQPDNINLETNADFALAMWMVHETPDFFEFFKQVKAVLKQGSSLLVVEPSIHVSAKIIEKEIEEACQAGFEFGGYVKIGFLSKGFILKT